MVMALHTTHVYCTAVVLVSYCTAAAFVKVRVVTGDNVLTVTFDAALVPYSDCLDDLI